MPRTIADLRRHENVSEQAAIRMMLALEGIESKPNQFDQNEWGSNSGRSRYFDFDKHEVTCNSACCFAGHIVARFADSKTPPNIRREEVGKEAIRLLGIIDELVISQIDQLFDHEEYWPPQFRNSDGYVTQALLRRRVEYYIETGETE